MSFDKTSPNPGFVCGGHVQQTKIVDNHFFDCHCKSPRAALVLYFSHSRLDATISAPVVIQEIICEDIHGKRLRLVEISMAVL